MISRYEVRFSDPMNETIKIITTIDARVQVPINLLETDVNYTVVVVAFDYADRKGATSKPLLFILGELDCFSVVLSPW